MSAFHDPFDPDIRLARTCRCGGHADEAGQDADLARVTSDSEALCSRAVDGAVMRALFPRE